MCALFVSKFAPDIFLRHSISQENNFKKFQNFLKIFERNVKLLLKMSRRILATFYNFILDQFPASHSLICGWVCPGRLPAVRRPARIHRLG
jgi:hypothetical protein